VVIEFKTENSTYVIDHENETWTRTTTNGLSNELRTDSGVLWGHSEIRVGRAVRIFGPPIVEGSTMRMITTSDVSETSEHSDGWYWKSKDFWEQIDKETSTYT
jgi:hypothetical protein